MHTILEQLRTSPDALDWFYITPPPLLGAWAPGEATGTYRTGGDVLFTVAEGKPGSVSGADIATAVIDEIETPTQRRPHFTVAY